MLTGDTYCLATNPASNCVLTIIEHVSGDGQGSVPILLSLMHATHEFNKELWYVDDILKTVLLPFLLQFHGLIFQQDNARPHTTRVAMNYLTAYQTLLWLARSPDPSPIENVWDMMGRRLHFPGNVDDMVH
ncbi:transposable element Tc1 transposase [Trichonephila clavipes]|nr:transposable element Tc1 transposase [Trichonephila clavipes]